MINKEHFNYTRISEDNWKKIYDLYVNKNYSLTKVIKEMNIKGLYTKKIAEFLRSKEIEVKNNQNERGCNHNIFEKINTEEKAYWLGFLYADGYVSKKSNCIELTLHLQDKEIIEKFKRFIGANNKFTYSSKWKTIRYSFGSKKIKKSLEKLGCCNAKTEKIKFPTVKQVPRDLIHHFIRGYFDGDGSLSVIKAHKHNTHYPRLSIIGTYDFLSYIKDKFLINPTNCKLQFASRTSKVYELKLTNKKAASFLNQIYSNSSIYLKRKNVRYRILKLNNFKIFKKNHINLVKNVYKKC